MTVADAWDDLEPAARRCPSCGYDVSAAPSAREQRCPECGYRYTLDELSAVHRDPMLRPGTPRRFRGLLVGFGWLLVAATLVLLSFVFVTVVIYVVTRLADTP